MKYNENTLYKNKRRGIYAYVRASVDWQNIGLVFSFNVIRNVAHSERVVMFEVQFGPVCLGLDIVQMDLDQSSENP